MTLFSNNPVRSAAAAAVAISIAHYGTKLISLHAFPVTQTAIAAIAMCALLFMIVMHHRMEGEMMNQTQEEAAFIGILALLWVVFLIGWKSIGSSTGSSKVGPVVPSKDVCLQDGVYCVYEEYYTW